MRNLVFLGFLLLVIFAVIGWFQDWYSFSNVKNEQGKTSVQVNFDKDKFQQDVGKAIDKVKRDTAPKATETKPAGQTSFWNP